MKPLNDITLELQALAPYLAQVERINVFRVPQHYFEQLPEHILDRCREADELSQIAPTLFHLQKTPVFEVPVGYFDLAYDETMEKNTGKISTETPTPQLDTTAHTPALTVPPAYFDQLHDSILAKVRAIDTANKEDSKKLIDEPINTPINEQINGQTNEQINDDSDLELPNLAKIAKINPFSVPQNYFEHLHERVFNQTIAALDDTNNDDEEQSDYPLLDKTASHSPFTVPQNYFDHLHDGIIKKVKKNQGGQLIKMQPIQSNLRKFAQYFTSAAAAITVLVVGYQLLSQNQQTNGNDLVAEAKIIPMEEVMAALNSISVNDLKSYVNANPDEFDEFLDDADILNKIDVQNLNAKDFTQDISADDIKSFINSNPDEFDELFDDRISDIKLDDISLDNINLDEINLDDFK